MNFKFGKYMFLFLFWYIAVGMVVFSFKSVFIYTLIWWDSIYQTCSYYWLYQIHFLHIKPKIPINLRYQANILKKLKQDKKKKSCNR